VGRLGQDDLLAGVINDLADLDAPVVSEGVHDEIQPPKLAGARGQLKWLAGHGDAASAFATANREIRLAIHSVVCLGVNHMAFAPKQGMHTSIPKALALHDQRSETTLQCCVAEQ
jgi:hypothetical protein